VAAIDVLRARVQLQTEQQRLIAAENQLALDKLALARVIGLPPGQSFTLVDGAPYTELVAPTLDEALTRALASRPDYQSAQAQVRASELAGQAARAGNYPSVSIDANYGAIGTSFARSNGTVAFIGSVAIPIFQGMTVPAQVLRADAALRRARAERDDFAGRIDEQVRAAFLNLTSANQLVAVTRSNVDLAKQTLSQAQDRLAAGVADNLEVVQAQESVATANQSFISSVYAYNSAKVALAQAVGAAEQSALSYLGVK
jgi:outer membrane protein TolC